MKTASLSRIGCLLTITAFLFVSPTWAQTNTSVEIDVNAIPAVEAPAGPLSLTLAPEMTLEVQAWLSVLIILALMLRPGPLFTLLNLDALALGVAALAFGHRGTHLEDNTPIWVHSTLAIIVGYFFLRGVGLLFQHVQAKRDLNVTNPGSLVFLVAGLLIAGNAVTTATTTSQVRDNLAGGVYFLQNQTMPHGQVLEISHESPMVNASYAGGAWVADVFAKDQLKLAETPIADIQSASTTNEPRLITAAIWITHLSLLALLLLGIWLVGKKLASGPVGVMVVTIFCVFPGVINCVNRVDILLPTLLLTWALAFALMRGLGGLFAGILVVFAGVAWPWAWSALPIVVAFLLRRGFQKFLGIIGVAGGVVGVVLAILQWITPAVPYAHLGMATAGQRPEYVAEMGDADQPTLSPFVDPGEPLPAVSAIRSKTWNYLLACDSVDMDSDFGHRLIKPMDKDYDQVFWRQLEAYGTAREKINGLYAVDIADADITTRFFAATRTILEPTWLAVTTDTTPTSAWAAWFDETQADRVTMTRRSTKIAAGAITLIIALMVLFKGKKQQRHIVGATLAVVAAVLFAHLAGPSNNWIFLLPFALAATVTHGGKRPNKEQQQRVPQRRLAPEPPRTPPPFDDKPIPLEPAPRISVEKH